MASSLSNALRSLKLLGKGTSPFTPLSWLKGFLIGVETLEAVRSV